MSRLIALCALACLVAGAIYCELGYPRVKRPVLHPAVLSVTQRPAAQPRDYPTLFPERSASQVALPVVRDEPGPEAAVRCLQAMGIPFFVTRDLAAALRHPLLLMYPEVDATTFTMEQAQSVNNFVARGGAIFAQNVFWGGFKPLFGFQDSTPLQTRHKIILDAADPQKSDPIFRYLNRVQEQQVPLGSVEIPQVIWTNSYQPAPGAQVLGRFEDGSAAVLKNKFGVGSAYLIGVGLADVVLRNQQNRDFEAQRIYVNAFEPGTDIWLLILRAWYETYSASGIRLGTVPQGKRSVLLLSHDVDWEYSFKPIPDFAAFERGARTSSTFFVQTKYLDDATSHAFFFGESLDILRQLAAGQSDIGSHTVIHSQRFNKVPLGTGEEKYPTYVSRATRENAAQDTTALGETCVSKSLLDGEIPAQHTIFFRAGHLRVPPFLPEALARCGYEFDSSFTAGDVLTNFPYELDFDLGMTEPANIFEFPVTFEDEQTPLLSRIPGLLDTIEANAENGAPSVLLIHTNNSTGKLGAERAILAQLPHDILVENMTAYARFWKARNQIRWFSRAVDGGEDTEINTDLPITGLTLASTHKVQAASGLPGIRFTDHEVILPDLAAKSQVTIHITYAQD